jgi:hypothetical protein
LRAVGIITTSQLCTREKNRNKAQNNRRKEESKHKTAQSINKEGRNTGMEGNAKCKMKDRKRNVTKRVEEAKKWQKEVFANTRSTKG